MTMKPERFTAVMFALVIGAFMTVSLFGIVSKATKRIEESGKAVKIEWEKIYPFEDGVKEAAEPSQSKISSFYNYVKGKLNEYTSQKMPGYLRIVEAAKRYENALGWNMVSVSDYNAVVRLKDGYLTTYTASLDVTQNAEAVKNFADFCAERGINFAYINFPTKICKSDDVSGVLDFANQNADKFLAMLKESGVRIYDFRKNLHRAGMNHHEAFFVTDHHWKPQTGLWAAREILKILRDDFSWDVEPEILSPENFEYVTYDDWFLGSEGKKVTLARTNPEDFTMIYPEFDTRFTFEIPGSILKVSGDFSVIYNMEAVETRNYYGNNPYGAYFYGDNPLAVIENMNITDEKKLLVIHESFSNSVIPFVALGVRHVDAVDLRHFTGSVKKFVEAASPNAVIVMYYSTVPGRGMKPSATKDEKRFYSMD